MLVKPVGGLPQSVAGLTQDRVLPATGADAIAEGIDAALSGRLKLPDAQACRDYARNHFDNAVVAKRVAEVYGEAIAAANNGMH